MGTTITPLTTEQLNAVAVSAIIAKAAIAARDQSLDTWKEVYEPAKAAIADFVGSSDEYEAAIKLLMEALGV